MIYYHWNDGKASYYELPSHGENHSHSKITGLSSGGGLPVTGLYAGNTTGIRVQNKCNQPLFGVSNTCFTAASDVKVGHISTLSMDSAATEMQTTEMNVGQGNGRGTESGEELKNTSGQTFQTSTSSIALSAGQTAANSISSLDVSSCQTASGMIQYSATSSTIGNSDEVSYTIG